MHKPRSPKSEFKRLMRLGVYPAVANELGNTIGPEAVKKIYDKWRKKVRHLDTSRLLELMRYFPRPAPQGDSSSSVASQEWPRFADSK